MIREILIDYIDFKTCQITDYAVRVDLTTEWYEAFVKKTKQDQGILDLRHFIAS